MTEYIQIATTTETREQAENIAQALVKRRLAACVQITGPIHSVYRWQEKVEQADEWLCTVKTRKSLFDEVETMIRQLHSYECPEIVATSLVAGSEAYLKWLGEQLVEQP
jgi:periplasmic divalent cation tolerance protein